MMTPEYLTVTVRSVRGTDLGDYRIPAAMTVGQLISLLLADGAPDLAQPTLCLKGYALPPDATAAQCGLWDGIIIILQEGTL